MNPAESIERKNKKKNKRRKVFLLTRFIEFQIEMDSNEFRPIEFTSVFPIHNWISSSMHLFCWYNDILMYV